MGSRSQFHPSARATSPGRSVAVRRVDTKRARKLLKWNSVRMVVDVLKTTLNALRTALGRAAKHRCDLCGGRGGHKRGVKPVIPPRLRIAA